MNILSIDWDYFFPDNVAFDWSMDDKKFIFYEIIWPIRWSNMHLETKKLAKDIYHPDLQLLNGFLDKILINSNPTLLSIAESHSDIQHLINLFPAKPNIYNFDQHHDIYYSDHPGKINDELNCGNWVSYFTTQINSYHLYYPAWRKSNPEHKDNRLNYATSVSYDIPNDPPKFHMVFICRSAPWTPSWSDHHWIKFIEYFKTNYRYTWDHKIALEYALKPRPFDKKVAEQVYKQTKEMME
jgi:hypothetical protein